MTINHGDVDFDKRRENDVNIFGSIVMVIRTYLNGEVETEWLPAALAVMSVLSDPDNGILYKSARIDYAGVYAGDWDGSA